MVCCIATLGAVRPAAAGAEDTNHLNGTDFASFRLLTERNIFNASRSGGRVAAKDTRPPVKVDTVALVGTMDYEKGLIAFFDGSSSEFRKGLKPQGTIAGCTITAITFSSVTLEAGGKSWTLPVGMALRREDAGEWQVAAYEAGTTSGGGSGPGSRTNSRRETGRSGGNSSDVPQTAAAAATGSSTASSSDASEVLKRLMEQREKENQ